jgi:hypothetical protein
VKPHITQALIFAIVVGLFCHFSIRWSSSQAAFGEIKELSRKLERERTFNVRRARRLHYMTEPRDINIDGIGNAYHLMGIAPSVTTALLFCENGPMDNESGSIDKTDFFVKNFPIEQRSALEGGRTLTRQLWTWVTRTPNGRKAFREFLSSAAGPYTAMSEEQQSQWVNNMLKTELRFENEIEVGPEGFLTIPMPTPTPVSHSGKPQSPGKRAHMKARQ